MVPNRLTMCTSSIEGQRNGDGTSSDRTSDQTAVGIARAVRLAAFRAMDPNIRITWTTLTIDCLDAEVLGAFYCGLLDWRVNARDGAGWVQLRDPHGGVGLNIQAEAAYEPPVWPEHPGHQAKMMHLEMLVDDLDSAARRVIDLGGSEALDQPPDRDRSRLRVMLDPAGHPFCLFVDGE